MASNTPEKNSANTGFDRTMFSLVLIELLLLVATYFSTAFPLPLKVIGLGFAVAGLAVSIVIIRRAVRTKANVFAWAGAIAGMIGSIFFGGIVASQVILWNHTAAFEECMSQALTDSATQRCQDEMTNSLTGNSNDR